jgi:hypothetical protein
MTLLRYKDFLARIIMSAIGAFLIVINGTHRTNLVGLISNPHFLYAMVSSFLIALMITALVRYVTLKLDRRIPWDTQLVQRLIAQVLFGIIAVMLVCIVAVTIYFLGMGIFTGPRKSWWIFNTTWFQVNSLPVLLMITIVNVYYYIYYQLAVHKSGKSTQLVALPLNLQDQNERPTQQILQLPVKPPLFFGRPFSDIVYIQSNKDLQQAYFNDGKSAIWKYTIVKGIDKLPKDAYMIANRSEIISFSNIIKAEYVNVERNMMKVRLKIPEGKVVEISRDNTIANRALLKIYL